MASTFQGQVNPGQGQGGAQRAQGARGGKKRRFPRETRMRRQRGLDASPWQAVAMGVGGAMDPFSRRGMNSQVLGFS